jgi:hypothetical protein
MKLFRDLRGPRSKVFARRELTFQPLALPTPRISVLAAFFVFITPFVPNNFLYMSHKPFNPVLNSFLRQLIPCLYPGLLPSLLIPRSTSRSCTFLEPHPTRFNCIKIGRITRPVKKLLNPI